MIRWLLLGRAVPKDSAVTNGPASSKEIVQVPSPKYYPHFRAAIGLAMTVIMRAIVQRSQQVMRQTRFANKGQEAIIRQFARIERVAIGFAGMTMTSSS